MTNPGHAAAIAAINHLLAQSRWATERLAPFCGRTAQLEMGSWQLTFVVSEDGHLSGADAGSGDCDVRIELPAATPFRLLGGREEVFRSARISGSADFADSLGFILRNLRWDAEEDLSRLFGDILARRMMGAIESGVAWQKQAAANFAENLAEYASFEAGLLPPAAEVRAFTARVTELTRDLAALEARSRRLVSKHPAIPSVIFGKS